MPVDLSHLKDKYAAAVAEAADEKDSTFDEIPDGKYTVEVLALDVKDKGGKLMLTWRLAVSDGPFVRRNVWRNNMLETETNLKWLFKDLRKCGVMLTGIEALEAETRCLIGVRLQITKKTTDGKYANVYIDKRLDAAAATTGNGAAAQAPAATGTEADDVIPF